MLADAGRGDWVLCQVTSKPYADPLAVELKDADFASGSHKLVSYARPGKLFTASGGLVVAEVGTLRKDVLKQIIEAITDMLKAAL